MKKWKFLIVFCLVANFFSIETVKANDLPEKTYTIEKSNINESGIEITKRKYITSGILGSSIGFGIGHMVQGRKTKGFAFLFSEASVISYFLITAFSALPKDSETDNLLFATLVGLRVWEIVDIWTVPQRQGDKYSVAQDDFRMQIKKDTLTPHLSYKIPLMEYRF